MSSAFDPWENYEGRRVTPRNQRDMLPIVGNESRAIEAGKTLVLRWDSDLEPDENDMEFRLTYAGKLLAHKDGAALPERSLHVHSVRREFHKQLKALWTAHPVLTELHEKPPEWHAARPGPPMMQIFKRDGFDWLPIVSKANGLICKVDILMLRNGPPGEVLFDIDNRLKTIFDALRMADGPYELGIKARGGQVQPETGEAPFYVLLQDDRLITHLSVTSDMLLQPVPHVPGDEAVRLVINVTVQPYQPYLENLGYA
jgi:hypothetical protein